MYMYVHVCTCMYVRILLAISTHPTLAFFAGVNIAFSVVVQCMYAHIIIHVHVYILLAIILHTSYTRFFAVVNINSSSAVLFLE